MPPESLTRAAVAALVVLATLTGGVGLAGGAPTDVAKGSVDPDAVDAGAIVSHAVEFTVDDVTRGTNTSLNVTVSAGTVREVGEVTVENRTTGDPIRVVSTDAAGDTAQVVVNESGSGTDDVRVSVALTVAHPDTTGTTDVTAAADQGVDGSLEAGPTTVGRVDRVPPRVRTPPSAYDAPVTSGQARWVGQRLLLKDIEGATETYELHRVAGSDRPYVGSLVTELPLNGSGETVFETGTLAPGRYVVTTRNGTVVAFGADGTATARDVPVDDAAFGLWTQTFSARFNESVAADEGPDAVRTLVLDSNRAGYAVTVSSSDLGPADLRRVFGDSPAFRGVASVDGRAVARLAASTRTRVRADLSSLDPRGYTFRIRVPDTGAATLAQLTVASRDPVREVEPELLREQAGDDLELTVELEDATDAYVFVGGPEVNLLERVHVRDADRDHDITISVDTGRMGSVSPPEAAYRSETDAVVDVSRPRPGSGIAGDADFDIDASLTDPPMPGVYPVVVTSTPTAVATDDGEAVRYPTASDAAAIALERPAVLGVSTLAAPRTAALSTPGDVAARAAPADTVARGDLLVLRARISGASGRVRTAADLQNEAGVYLVVRERSPGPNRAAGVLDLAGPGVRLVATDATRANDTYLVVVDTREARTLDGRTLRRGRYRVRLLRSGPETTFVESTFEEVYDRPASEATVSPYLADGALQEAGTTVTLAGRSLTLRVEGERLVLPAGNATVRADTTLAPGTEVTVLLAGASSLRSRTVRVENGTVAATFDLRSVPVGASLSLAVRSGGRTLDRSAVRVGPAPGRPTPTTEVRTRSRTPTERAATTETPFPTAVSTEVTPSTGTGTTTDAPGFGAPLAVGAVVAAVLLARRRGD